MTLSMPVFRSALDLAARCGSLAAMGGVSVTADVIHHPGSAKGAMEKLHHLVIRTIEWWMEVNLRGPGKGEVGARLFDGYYGEAVRHARQLGLWGPSSSGDRVQYFFSDFEGRDLLGARVMSHWYELALSLCHERMRPLVLELGLEISARVRSPDRIVTGVSRSPLVQLGDAQPELYLLEWPDSGRPEGEVLVSSEGIPRRSLASLSEAERQEASIRAVLRQCGCGPCETLRRWYWEGKDPWGRLYDFGWDRGVALFDKGDFQGSRRAFLDGVLRGAPFAQEGFGVWIASTFARQGDAKQGLEWLRHAVFDGFSRLEELRADPDFAPLRGPELDALVAAGPRRRVFPGPGSYSQVLPAWKLLVEPALERQARALGERLGAGGPMSPYPAAAPEELGALLGALEARGARPPPSALVAMCEQIAAGALALPREAAPKPSGRSAPPAEVLNAASSKVEEMLAAELEARGGKGEGWELCTTPPLPDRWPLTPEARLVTYAFAYRDDPESPTLMIASSPFACVSHGLAHDDLELTSLDPKITELGVQAVFPIGPGVIEGLRRLPSYGVLFASALERRLGEEALSALAQRYAFFQRAHGQALGAVQGRHADLFSWLKEQEV